jgi:UDP-N-acetylglucosamine 2-epimerase (non-hydrolysing)
LEPFGFFDFIRLEQGAYCVLSDSGTIQEEACILGIPNITLRDATERQETIECGSNVVAGCDPERVLELVNMVTREQRSWVPPAEYTATHVAETVCKIITSFRQPDPAEVVWQEKAYFQIKSRGYAM